MQGSWGLIFCNLTDELNYYFTKSNLFNKTTHCFSAFFTLKEFFILMKKIVVNPLRKKFSPFWSIFFSVWGSNKKTIFRLFANHVIFVRVFKFREAINLRIQFVFFWKFRTQSTSIQTIYKNLRNAAHTEKKFVLQILCHFVPYHRLNYHIQRTYRIELFWNWHHSICAHRERST